MCHLRHAHDYAKSIIKHPSFFRGNGLQFVEYPAFGFLNSSVSQAFGTNRLESARRIAGAETFVACQTASVTDAQLDQGTALLTKFQLYALIDLLDGCSDIIEISFQSTTAQIDDALIVCFGSHSICQIDYPKVT